MQTNQKEPRLSLFAMFVLGICLGAPLLLYGIFAVVDNVTTFAAFLVIALLIVITNIGLIIYFRKKIWNMLGSTWDSILNSVQNATSSFSKGSTQEGLDHSFDAAKKVVAKSAWAYFIGGCFIVCFALISAFSGVLNSALVYNQNELFKLQNKLLDGQNELIAAETKFFKEQEDSRKKEAKVLRITELRRRLDTILYQSVEGHVVAHIGATFGELLDVFLEADIDSGIGYPSEVLLEARTALHQSDTRIFLLILLKNQISIERATEIISELESLESKEGQLLSVADYVGVSNGLFSTGQLNLAESFAKKGLKRQSESIIKVFINLHLGRIDYARGRVNDARLDFDAAARLVDDLEYSENEAMGFKAILSAMQAHFELDSILEGPSNEKIDESKLKESISKIEIAKNLIQNLPLIDRGIRWRTQHVIDSFEGRVNSLVRGRETADLSDEQLKFHYFKQYNSWAQKYKSLNDKELLRHLKAQREARNFTYEVTNNREPPAPVKVGPPAPEKVEPASPENKVPPAPEKVKPEPEKPNSKNPKY